MALAFTPVDGMSLAQTGQYSITCYDIILDTDYPTTGWPIQPGEVGLGTVILGAEVIGHRGAAGAVATTGYLFLFDYVSQRLQSFDTGAAASAPFNESTAGDDDLATRRIRVLFYGY